MGNNYAVFTENTQTAIDTMNGYSGTSLIHTSTNYLYWEWINALDADVNAVLGADKQDPSVNTWSMTLSNGWMP